MIARSAIRKYLSRSLSSFAWLKLLARDEVEAEINKVLPPVRLYTPAWLHQLVCLLIGVNRPQFLFFLDVGTGKTKIMLDIIYNRAFSGEVVRTLVLVPNRTNIWTWREQIRLHQPSLRAVSYTGSPAERERRLQRRHDIVIMTYAAWQLCCCERGIKGRRKRIGRVLEKGKATKFLSQFQCIVYDETHSYLQNASSVSFSIARLVTKLIPYRYGLTGTPTGRDPQDLWAQFYAIDRGATLGNHLGLFRESLFTKKRNWFSGFPEYKFDKKNAPLLNRMMQHRSIWYDEKECVDLPDLVKRNIVLKLPQEIDAHYRDILVQIRKARGNRQVVESSYHKMRMLSSGFLHTKGEDGVKGVVEFPTNVKLERLVELIDEIGPGHKFVIFHVYVWSGRRISLELEKRGIRHVILAGGMRDPEKALRSFTRDSRVRGAVVNVKAGGTGTNLQVANYGIFYEEPDDPKILRQALKRVHRSGQTKRTFLYFLMMAATADTMIHDNNRQGRRMAAAIVAGKLDALERRRRTKRLERRIR
jgi:SNF2 family DNA or RNA helicase